MSDIFISYAKEDRERARTVAEALEKFGWSVFWDRKIPPGKTWDEFIGNALNKSKCVVVLWSKLSVKRDWVKEEANVGKQRGILVPALIDDADIPLGFTLIQAAELTNWKTDKSDPGFASFIDSITEKVDTPSASKPVEEEERKQKKEEAKREATEKAERIEAERIIQKELEGEKNHRRQAAKIQLKKMGIKFDEPSFLKRVEDGEKKAVKLFLEAGMNYDSKDNYGNTALILAVKKGHVETAKALISEGADVNAGHYGDNPTPLIIATICGCVEIVKVLIEAGADVNARMTDGTTALLMASSLKEEEKARIEIVKTLIAEGADVNAKNKNGQSVLSRAALIGNLEIVRILGAAGAEANAKDKDAIGAHILMKKFKNKKLDFFK